MALVLNTDFVGEYAVSQSCYGSLGTYITKYEKEFLVSLFGAELYILFIADLDAALPQAPQTARFITLYNSFDIDNKDLVESSEGLRKAIVQYIYFHYTRDSNFSPTNSGVMRTVSEVSSILPYNGFNLIQSYNQSIANYHSIQWYIVENLTTYPEENSQHKCFSSGI
jgi:hypothetical protein